MLPLVHQAAELSNSLGRIHDIRVVKQLNESLQTSILQFEPRLGMEAKEAISKLVIAQDMRLVQSLAAHMDSHWSLALNLLREIATQACASLRMVNEWNLAHNLASYGPSLALPNLRPLHILSRQTQNAISTAHQIRIVSPIAKSEEIRQKSVEDCIAHATWAGEDLQRWHQLHKEYQKRPKRYKLMARFLANAHRDFLGLLAETNKIAEIRKRCENNPFLLLEFGKLQEKIAQYYEERARAATREKLKGRTEELKEVDSEKQATPKNRPSFRI